MASSRQYRSNGRRSGRLCLACFAGAATLLQVCLILAESRAPELVDTEYAFKLNRLRAQIESAPERPLVLLLGSSRTLNGLRPEAVEQSLEAHHGAAPIVFNMGMTAAGAIRQGIVLQRLLDAGIRPTVVMIEIHPALLRRDNQFGEHLLLNSEALTLPEVVRATRRYGNAREVNFNWWLHFSKHNFVWRYLPRTMPIMPWSTLDDYGWLASTDHVLTESERERRAAHTHKEYLPALMNFQLEADRDSASHDLLELCRANGIATALYLMPEAEEFRAMYSPEAREEIDKYLAALSQEFDSPIYDATFWAEDVEFADCHHLLPEGALRVSRRFAEQIASPVYAELLDRERSQEQLARQRSNFADSELVR